MLNILAKSFSDPALSPSMSGLRVIPAGFSTVNYDIVFSNKVILPTLWNSIFITVVGTAINILLTTSAAYVLIQPGLMFKKIIMTFLIVMMLSTRDGAEYLLVKQLGLIGSQWSVILVTSVNVYYLIIMMRYFQAVPMDIYEAARIDGAGHVRMIFSMVFPLAKSGIATITMFYAVVQLERILQGQHLPDGESQNHPAGDPASVCCIGGYRFTHRRAKHHGLQRTGPNRLWRIEGSHHRDCHCAHSAALPHRAQILYPRRYGGQRKGITHRTQWLRIQPKP